MEDNTTNRPAFSNAVKIKTIDDFGAIALKMVDVFGDTEAVKMLRAMARLFASGKATK